MLEMIKTHSLKSGFEALKPSSQPSMHDSIRNVNPLKSKVQWGHSGANKSSWIRLHASISNETKITHKQV